MGPLRNTWVAHTHNDVGIMPPVQWTQKVARVTKRRNDPQKLWDDDDNDDVHIIIVSERNRQPAIDFQEDAMSD